jgi:phage tail tape-measure protein
MKTRASNIGKRIGQSKIGQFVQKINPKAAAAAAAAVAAKYGKKIGQSKIGQFAKKMNPMNLFKKVVKGNAGRLVGKMVKGGLIGALLNIGTIASILSSDAPKLQKAQGVVKTGSGIIGGILGSVLGSVIGPAGTFLGGMGGAWLGNRIGEMPAIQKALASPLAPHMPGGKSPKPVGDFSAFLPFLGIRPNAADQIIGTKEGGLIDKKLDKMIELLAKMVEGKEVILQMDNKEVARKVISAVNNDFYNIAR